MPRPNIVLIVIDALRARNLGCYGYDKPTSPNIDALAKKSAFFQHCFSTTNVTDPSFTTIFSGQFPATHGIVEQGMISANSYQEKVAGLVPLPEILKENGYLTVGVDWLGRWHKRGFDTYSGAIEKRRRILNDFVVARMKQNQIVNRLTEAIKKVVKHSLYQPDYGRAGAVTDYALRVLKNTPEQPFFLFVHYWDTHIPYNAPREHLNVFRNLSYHEEVEDPKDIWKDLPDGDWRYFLKEYMKGMKSTGEALARYDGAIHFIDSEIGRLLDGMKRMGTLQNSLVIITSDHGESLTEHGIYFDHHSLYDELIHVPLIIHYPKGVPAKRLKTTVQHIDVTPTVLDIAGIDYDGGFDGKSLVPLITGSSDVSDWHPFIYVEETKTQRKFAIRTAKYKYIFAPSEAEAICNYCGRVHGGVEELYELEVDPGEKHNIVGEKPEVRNELRETLIKFRGELEKRNQQQQLREKIKKLKIAGKI